MNAFSPAADPAGSDSKLERPAHRSPLGKIALLVGLNFLSVPPAAFLFYRIVPLVPETRGSFSFILFGIYHGHLFLLAYWMAFGGVPKTGRRLLVSLLTILGALPIGVMTAHQVIRFQYRSNAPFGWDELPALVPYVVNPPLIALTIVWLLHSFFMIPQYFANATISFKELPNESPHSPPSHGIAWQLFIWCVYFAAPIGLYLLLYGVDESGTQVTTRHLLISTLFSVVALTPASLLLVTEDNFTWKIGASIGWFILSMLAFLLIPLEWAVQDSTLHLATGATVILNLLILHALGLRWLGAASPALSTRISAS